MDELRNLHGPARSVAARRTARAPERPNRLGRTLREAREDRGLDLRDLAEITSVRLTHLEALEAGDYGSLPETYSKHFVRLYAQAVGLDPARALLLYAQERRRAALPVREAGLELPHEPPAAHFDDPRLGRLLRPLLTPLLVVGTVLVALWAFNGLLFTAEPRQLTGATSASAPTPVPEAPTTALTAAAPTTATAAAPLPADTMVLLSLQTTPPGAEISIDGYRFGQSPIVDAPVRAGARAVRVERGGYRTFERTLDLSVSRRLNVELVPTTGQGAATVTGVRVQTPSRTGARARVTITVTAEAWLEVYAGAARGDGERLVYETARPGDTFSFSAPVYVFSGNAGGVMVARGDAVAAPLGASGAVAGAAY